MEKSHKQDRKRAVHDDDEGSEAGGQRKRRGPGESSQAAQRVSSVPAAAKPVAAGRDKTSWLSSVSGSNDESKLFSRDDEHASASKKALNKYMAALHLCDESNGAADSHLGKAAASLKSAAKAFAGMQRERQSAGLTSNTRKQETPEDAMRVSEQHAQALDLALALAEDPITKDTIMTIHAVCTDGLCETAGKIRTKGVSVGSTRCCAPEVVEDQLANCLNVLEEVCMCCMYIHTFICMDILHVHLRW